MFNHLHSPPSAEAAGPRVAMLHLRDAGVHTLSPDICGMLSMPAVPTARDAGVSFRVSARDCAVLGPHMDAGGQSLNSSSFLLRAGDVTPRLPTSDWQRSKHADAP